MAYIPNQYDDSPAAGLSAQSVNCWHITSYVKGTHQVFPTLLRKTLYLTKYSNIESNSGIRIMPSTPVCPIRKILSEYSVYPLVY